MENKEVKTKKELLSDRKCLICFYLPFILIFIGGLIIESLNDVICKTAGGLFLGFSVVMMVLLGVAIGETNEEIRNVEKKRIDDAVDKYNKIGEKIMEYRTETEIYDNLRFRERVLKDKFGGITNKKLREEFLKTKLSYSTSVKDAIVQFQAYMFGNKQMYKIVLEEFQKKQAVLNEYAEKPKRTKRGK